MAVCPSMMPPACWGCPTYLVLQGHSQRKLVGLRQGPGNLLQDLDQPAEGHPAHHLIQRAVEQGKRLGRAEGRAGI